MGEKGIEPSGSAGTVGGSGGLIGGLSASSLSSVRMTGGEPLTGGSTAPPPPPPPDESSDLPSAGEVVEVLVDPVGTIIKKIF